VNHLDQIETDSFVTGPRFLSPSNHLRVLNWNINRGVKLEEVVEFLHAANADLILLQESDLNARRTQRVNVAREIAMRLKMNYVFAREFHELAQGSAASPAFHGQATLSPWPFSNARIVRFQRQSHFWNPHWFIPEFARFQKRIGGRLALVTQIHIAGRAVISYNLHLESKCDDAFRCSQIEETLEDTRRYDASAPVVLAGDLNLDVSGGPASTAISQAQFQDVFANQHVPTTPYSFLEPGRSIDWIFIRGPIHATIASVHSSISASDHYPLSVVLSLP
jgi:endonuclease/exonuclease/phosphatase family metal-dependent hydrolase